MPRRAGRRRERQAPIHSGSASYSSLQLYLITAATVDGILFCVFYGLHSSAGDRDPDRMFYVDFDASPASSVWFLLSIFTFAYLIWTICCCFQTPDGPDNDCTWAEWNEYLEGGYERQTRDRETNRDVMVVMPRRRGIYPSVVRSVVWCCRCACGRFCGGCCNVPPKELEERKRRELAKVKKAEQAEARRREENEAMAAQRSRTTTEEPVFEEVV